MSVRLVHFAKHESEAKVFKRYPEQMIAKVQNNRLGLAKALPYWYRSEHKRGVQQMGYVVKVEALPGKTLTIDGVQVSEGFVRE